MIVITESEEIVEYIKIKMKILSIENSCIKVKKISSISLIILKVNI